jgi:hypothetical protein
MKKLLLVALLCTAGAMFGACCEKKACKSCKPCCKKECPETCPAKPCCVKTVEVKKEPCKVCEKVCHWECPADTKMEEAK